MPERQSSKLKTRDSSRPLCSSSNHINPFPSPSFSPTEPTHTPLNLAYHVRYSTPQEVHPHRPHFLRQTPQFVHLLLSFLLSSRFPPSLHLTSAPFFLSFVSSSSSAGGQTGWYLPELAHSYYVFKDSGFNLTLASPAGGKSPLDEGSVKLFAEDEGCARFLKDQEALHLVDTTVKLGEVNEKGELTTRFVFVLLPRTRS